MPCRANLIPRQGGEPKETAAQAAAGGPQTEAVGAVREPPSQRQQHKETGQPLQEGETSEAPNAGDPALTSHVPS